MKKEILKKIILILVAVIFMIIAIMNWP